MPFPVRRATSRTSRAVLCLATLGSVVLSTASAVADEASVSAREVRALREEVADLRRREEESRRRIAELETAVQAMLETSGGSAAPVAAATAASSATPAGPGAPSAPADPNVALDRAIAAGADANANRSNSPDDPVDRALERSAPGRGGDLASVTLAGGAAQARLIDVSLSTLVAAGGSSVGDEELGRLQAGGHDPRRNGFTLQQAELSFTGAVDPYFRGEAHIVAGEEGLELEEAFLTTTALPYGLQVEAGYSLTEFGLHNPTHAHAWDWMDQPVILSRLLGPDGLRSAGARAAWLLPLPFFSELHLGVQNANDGELTASFVGEEGVGGRPNRPHDVRSAGDMLWLVRSNSSWDLNDDAALLVGASALFGPNATGPDADTRIYGIDAKIRWRPHDNFRGWPFVVWQLEAARRDFDAAPFAAGTDVDPESGEFPFDLPGDTLHDQGFYTQLLYGFRYGWAAGLRAEYATGSGGSVAEGLVARRGDDFLRDDRVRVSPLLVWHPTEYSRLRLQYNWDDADHLGGGAHTVWIGGEVLYGKHAAHKY